MKKILLVMIALISLFSLAACKFGAKVEELEIEGSSAKAKDIQKYLENMAEYLEENELKNQWYKGEVYQIFEADDEFNGLNDYVRVTEMSGKYYYSKFAYEQKAKFEATITETYELDDEEYESVTKITYIYIDGKEYCKESTKVKSKTTNSESVSYTSGSSEVLGDIGSFTQLLYGSLASVLNNPEYDLKKDDGYFAGSLEEKVKKQYEAKYQFIYKFDEKTYQPKSYESYESFEDLANKTVSVSYTSISKAKFGSVKAPSNPEKYL